MRILKLGRTSKPLALFLALTLLSTAFATLLSLSDPLGDAVGDGSLASPTAERFNGAGLDIRSLNVLEGDTLTFQLELASRANSTGSSEVDSPGSSAAERPIIELYLDSEPGGPQTLLPGSGMQIDGGWEVAFQIAGNTLRVFTASGENTSGEPTNEFTDATDSLEARLTQQGNVLTVTTSLATPRRFSLYGMLGSYDPFSESGWRAVGREPSPWHFSSPTQTSNVLDVMVDDPALQIRAIERGVLPEIRTSFRSRRWLLVAAAGALIAIIGFILRLFAPTQRTPAAPSTAATNEQSPDTPTDTNASPASYGARDAGERAQVLRSIDFEALQKGDWLEPLDEEPLNKGQGASQPQADQWPLEADKDEDAFERVFGKEFGD